MLNPYFLTMLLIAVQPSMSSANEHRMEARKGYDFAGNGIQTMPCFTGQYKEDFAPVEHIALDSQQLAAVTAQQQWLARQQTLTSSQEATKSLIAQPVVDLSSYRFKLLAGEDNCGNTLLTSYYSPQLKLKRKSDAIYRYPVYRKPEDKNLLAFTRQQLEQNQQPLRGLEIGYAASMLDVFLLQVQGSGFVHFVDTHEQALLGFAAANQHTYVSIGQYLVATGAISAEEISLNAIYRYFERYPEKLQQVLWLNPRFIFFSEQLNTSPMASNGTPAIAYATIAVDKTVIPHGSMVLIEQPVLSAERHVIGREYRLYLANDVGSAIKGAGRVDIYAGLDNGAGDLVHYGRVWLVVKVDDSCC
ncbi:TPA: MltA domain-containing protein [Vibrio cholerae]|nr:MltA domain-containing protein [Vibrio cholerae]